MTRGTLAGATAAVAAVGRRPDLWATALRQLRVLTPTGWWRRRPFLPVPDGEYLRFRLVTAFGGDSVAASSGPSGPDVVAYLEWCRVVRPLMAHD